MKVLLTVIYLLRICLSRAKLPTLTLPFNYVDGLLETTVSVGEPKQKLQVRIYQYPEQNFISSSHFNVEASSSIQLIKDYEEEYQDKLYSDNLYFYDHSISSVYFLHNETLRGQGESWISLSRYQLFPNNSFVTRLKDTQKIFKEVYIIRPLSLDNGVVIFGEEDLTLPLNESFSCEVNQGWKTWACDVKVIKFDNFETFEVGDTFSFEVNEKGSIFECRLLEHIEKLLNSQEDEPICEIRYKGPKSFTKIIFCRKSLDFDEYSDLFIMFSGPTERLRVKLKYLFDCEENQCSSTAKCKSDKVEYVLGNDVLRNYISIFDAENQTITFYDIGDTLGRGSSESKFYLFKLILMVVLSVNLIFFCILNVYSKCKNIR